MFENLFSPLQIGPITIKNRIQITPHELQYYENGLSTEVVDNYFVERARGGTALMELSQLMIKPPFGIQIPSWEYDSTRRFPLMNTPDLVPGLSRLSNAVHTYGAKIFMEISAWIWLFGPVSAIPFETGAQLKELTVSDIREIEEGFAIASKRVKEGGFDGIDLHGTHGAMIEHFYSPATNRRDDRYGGTLENRLRFLFEVVDAVRGSVGESMAVGMRLCADEKLEAGVTPEYAKRMASLFDGRIDFVNVGSGSAGYFEVINQTAHQTEPLYTPRGHGVHLAAAVKSEVTKTKVGAVGKILDPVQAEEILTRGFADYAGMTRALIADPELPRKASEGRLEDIRPCIGTLQDCWGRSVTHEWPMRCTVNAAVGREKERASLKPAARKKRVLVIGSGPAGLEASRVAAERGHDVTVYERSSAAGGQALLAAKLPGRSDIRAIIAWELVQLQKLGVKIKYRAEITSDPGLIESVLKEEEPEAVVIATGSHPIRNGLQMVTYREVPGWDGPNVRSVDEVLLGDDTVQLKGRVVVADSTNHVEGSGTAEWLARRGAKVTLVTPHSHISPQLTHFNQLVYLLTRLQESGVRTMNLSWPIRIERDRVVVRRLTEGVEEEVLTDQVVLNTGRQQNAGIKEFFVPFVEEIHEIGDCNIAGGMLGWAIESGYVVGSKL